MPSNSGTRWFSSDSGTTTTPVMEPSYIDENDYWSTPMNDAMRERAREIERDIVVEPTYRAVTPEPVSFTEYATRDIVTGPSYSTPSTRGECYCGCSRGSHVMDENSERAGCSNCKCTIYNPRSQIG